MGIQKYVPLEFYFLKAIMYLTIENEMKLGALNDSKSFI